VQEDNHDKEGGKVNDQEAIRRAIDGHLPRLWEALRNHALGCDAPECALCAVLNDLFADHVRIERVAAEQASVSAQTIARQEAHEQDIERKDAL